MATSLDGSWLPGIGDPSPVGWLTVAAYFAAAWTCWRLVAKGSLHRTPMPTPHRRFWWLLTGAMIALGINKQLDLQTAFTEIGRSFAQSGGWYAQRHQVQVVFIGLIGVAGVLTLAGLCFISRPLSRGRALALGGLVFLAGFVVVRAASFHNVDEFISRSLMGLRWNWIVELTGIGLLASGAWLEWQHRAVQRGASSRASPAAPLRAAFTPYRRPSATAQPATEPKPSPSPAPSAPSVRPAPETPHAARRHSGDDRPVRSPGDPRNRA